MAASIDPLVVGRVIGDVVDMFVPSVTMNVYFGSKHVTNGCDIKPSIASNPPRVTISGHPHQLYTLVMTDPDAPSPSEPSMREWVHWIVTDIPGGTGPTQGNKISHELLFALNIDLLLTVVVLHRTRIRSFSL
ncbi:protein MOTHER of FT and TFL1-like [Camellia sinensis]|uniref:protein MOTHER of FT and TFL1-like n=1 Tax=Camellia sinensis TaxID=4442 RepID=UPI001035DBD9|nr:protein MOTHER of FT and TFL1-like [Camellia sinensis]